MRLTGTLLELEDYSGDFKGEDGSQIAYSGQRLHVLDGREVVKVKIPKDQVGHIAYADGDRVDLRVQVGAQQGARGAYLTVQLVGDFPL
jgi:hypothetical protein